MTDQERLKQIKRNFRNGYDFNPSSAEESAIEEDFTWLIQQVEHWKKCTESEQKIAGKLQKKVKSLEKQNNELTGIGGMWMSARNKLEESQKENQRYKLLLESAFSIIQLSDLDEKEHPYGKSLKQIENLIIDSWVKEGES